MAEDLKYETKTSHCPNYNTGEDCEVSNFYSYEELENVCPDKWRIPTTQDWDVLLESLENVEFARLMEKNKKLFRVDFLNRYNFFDGNPINLVRVGRTEGNIWQKGKFSDYWTTNLELDDARFHMHITSYSLVGHAHKHHVSEKNESKNRKFAVRCVCEKEE